MNLFLIWWIYCVQLWVSVDLRPKVGYCNDAADVRKHGLICIIWIGKARAITIDFICA